MLKNLLKKTYLMFNKVKVVHSIPGRIRLFIPSLDQFPEQMKKYENYITAIIKLKAGINNIEYSYTTSKILVEYNKTKLKEEKELVAPRINNLDLETFKKGVLGARSMMPSYFLTDEEINLLYEYVINFNKDKK